MNAKEAQTLTYRFLDLPHISRLEIALQLGLCEKTETQLEDTKLFELIFQRAIERKVLEKFYEAIEQKHGL